MLFSILAFAKYPLLIYYGQDVSFKEIEEYEVVVLDPDSYDDVNAINSITYAYISLGEVREERDFFESVKKLGVTGSESKEWKGSYFVTLKGGKWQEFLLDRLIPSIKKRGYNGLFLDTVDSLLQNGEKKEEIVKLIASIKSRYPEISLFLNRGFEVANSLKFDAILLESTITGYNFETKQHYFHQSAYIPKIDGGIKKYSLDYWDESDTESIKKIYKIALDRGYSPMVGEISLQKIPKVKYGNNSKKFFINNAN